MRQEPKKYKHGRKCIIVPPDWQLVQGQQWQTPAYPNEDKHYQKEIWAPTSVKLLKSQFKTYF